jgi:hypothetical protein
MTPRRGVLAEPAMCYSDGWIQMMVLAEGLRLALLDEGSQVQPYRCSEDHPFDALHDLNHSSTCPITAGHLDLSGKLEGGIFTSSARRFNLSMRSAHAATQVSVLQLRAVSSCATTLRLSAARDFLSVATARLPRTWRPAAARR